MKQSIALVMGGYSGEHYVSIASGNQVYAQLDHARYDVTRVVIDRGGWYAFDDNDNRYEVNRHDFSVDTLSRHITFDLAFIIIHGNPGENGVLQGYFDMLGIPYTTCDFYTSSLTFHKGFCNPVVAKTGIVSVAPSVLLYHMPDASDLQRINAMRYPLFVKPATGGSSVATTKVKTPEQLEEAIALAFTEDRQVLVEQGIKGREFDCGVFQTDKERLVFPITEIIPTGNHEFFDYEAKYAGFSNEVTPAECPVEVAQHIQQVSSQLYDHLGCRGIVRFDYIYDTEADELYFLEVNTIPGQSAESIVPKQARAIGISPSELYQMVIDTALHDKRQ